MKYINIIFLPLVILISCRTNQPSELHEGKPTCRIDQIISFSNIAGDVLIDTTFAYYDDNGRMVKIINRDYSYGFTTISNYSLEYSENGKLSKVYRQNPEFAEKPDSSDRMFLEIEYINNNISRIIYYDRIVGDIIYESGLIQEHKYYYHFNSVIDTFHTRSMELEYDNLGNIIRMKDYRIVDNKQLYDAIISSDTLFNPFYNSALSLVPELHFFEFISPHNWIEDRPEQDPGHIYGSQKIKYNNYGYPISKLATYEDGFVYYDSIIYTCLK